MASIFNKYCKQKLSLENAKTIVVEKYIKTNCHFKKLNIALANFFFNQSEVVFVSLVI